MQTKVTTGTFAIMAVALLWGSWAMVPDLPEPEAPLPAVTPCDERAQPVPDARGRVVFTFDGNWAGQLQAAASLEEHGYCATFYVAPGTMRQGPYFTQFLSREEVRDLARAGHDVGSHTLTHVDLTQVDDERLRVELAQSQAELEAITGRPVTSIAYPHGAFDGRVTREASLHYLAGRGVEFDLREDSIEAVQAYRFGEDDPYEMPAFGIGEDTTLEQAKALVDHAYENDAVVILSFQDLRDDPRDFDWTPERLSQLIAYVAERDVRVQTMDQLVTETVPAAA